MSAPMRLRDAGATTPLEIIVIPGPHRPGMTTLKPYIFWIM
jgi:hypothetical protein